MIKGLYSAGSGMVTEAYRQQLISHNLANLTTTGYKADRVAFQAYPGLAPAEPGPTATVAADVPPGDSAQVGAGVVAEDGPIDFAQGDLRQTGMELDLALAGAGFFALQTPGGTVYTRDGSFHRSPEGVLVNAEGYPVLGQNGPITVGTDPVTVTPEGVVTQNGQEIGRLQIVAFAADQRLLRVGYGHYQPQNAQAPTTPSTASVVQGALEASNVDVVQNMTEMISAMRSYEASQRMVLYQDQILSHTVNELGRVG